MGGVVVAEHVGGFPREVGKTNVACVDHKAGGAAGNVRGARGISGVPTATLSFAKFVDYCGHGLKTSADALLA
jgi:hypothetical protein